MQISIELKDLNKCIGKVLYFTDIGMSRVHSGKIIEITNSKTAVYFHYPEGTFFRSFDDNLNLVFDNESEAKAYLEYLNGE